MTHTDIIAPEHPGTFISGELEARGWDKGDLAYILRTDPDDLSRILNGKVGVSEKMANALGDAFDISAEFFANLQKLYDLGQAEKADEGVKTRAIDVLTHKSVEKKQGTGSVKKQCPEV